MHALDLATSEKVYGSCGVKKSFHALDLDNWRRYVALIGSSLLHALDLDTCIAYDYVAFPVHRACNPTVEVNSPWLDHNSYRITSINRRNYRLTSNAVSQNNYSSFQSNVDHSEQISRYLPVKGE